MIECEILRVPMPLSGRIEIYSGIARQAGTLWATLWRETKCKVDTAVVWVHPASNFLGHYALRPLAELGVAAVGMTTRYLGNDSALILENCVLDVAAVVAYLRSLGYGRIVLVGNSGGGGLSALYQAEAEHPSITATPAGDPVDLTKADLPVVDALVLAMAHPGRATILTEWLDPAIVDETRPLHRERSLDMFDARNGPPYSDDFLGAYRSAQVERNRRITTWVREQLDLLATYSRPADGRCGTSVVLDDLPFVVHGTAADPRFLDGAIDPSDRELTTLWGAPWQANYMPFTLGHHTSLRSWLSQWSCDLSHGNAPSNLPRVSAPTQVLYGTADEAVFPSHARGMYELAGAKDKEIVAIRHARHYYTGQPELAREMCQHIVRWARR